MVPDREPGLAMVSIPFLDFRVAPFDIADRVNMNVVDDNLLDPVLHQLAKTDFLSK